MLISRSRTHLLAFFVTAVLAAAMQLAPSASASLGRVVALGDSMASGMGLGPVQPMINPSCGRTTGSYPQLAFDRLSPSSTEDVTCNGGHSGVFSSGHTGLNIPENNGAFIPPQLNALNGSEQAVIVGTGGNEAYFGETAFNCLGLQSNSQKLAQYGYPLPPGQSFTNGCIQTYGANGAGLQLKVNNAESLVGPALDKVRQKSPNARVFLIGIPRLVTPSGAGCMPNPILTAADAPVYAIWEDQLRLAMKRVVSTRSWATYVDVQEISGTDHTMCAAQWADRWTNPWSYQYGIPYPGIALHNTPAGADAMANTIIDSFHAEGLDTGSQSVNATNPVVNITAPTGGLITKNATVNVSFTATDNVRIKNCSHTSGQSVALAPGVNTITVTCSDHAGNSGQAQVTVTRDNTAPTIAITSPADGANTTAASMPLTYTASDNVGTPSCSPASGTSRALVVGANTLSVSCTDSAGNAATAAVVVNRGSVPAVAITSPQNGLSTTSATVNVAFTVGGGASIPPNTTCSVDGSPTTDASANTVILAEGANTITVACSNQFGSGTPVSVTVTGSPPSDVAIIAPAEGINTTASTVNVVYLVSGAATIPPSTTCTVAGGPSSSTTTNPVGLTLGNNTITVTCTGAFGSKSASVHVVRGNVPVVAITAPASGTNTAASSVNVAYTVGGAPSIPAGTSCTVGGSASSSAATNNVALSLGSNSIPVTCTNQFGSSLPTSVAITRGVPPVVAITAPDDGLNTAASTSNIHFSVDGSPSIPAGTTCTLNSASTSAPANNPVGLALGTNIFIVSCTNVFGANSASVTINRGNPPGAAISAPVDGLKTAGASIDVAFSATGGGSSSCTVNGVAAASSPASVALGLGANTITVVCTNQFGTGAPSSVTVTRGNAPSVSISAPLNNFNTTSASVNVGYSVNGSGTSIPADVSCTVADQSSTSPQAINNQRSIAVGTNTIVVACSNVYGTGSAAVIVNRGSIPLVAITTPEDGTLTTAANINVSFTVGGNAFIPVTDSCTVGGISTISAVTNNVALGYGTSSITVACTNAFGTGSKTVSVIRGNGPSVAITQPSSGGLITTASSTLVSFTVDGSPAIPVGTACSVDGAPKTTTSGIVVALELGTNVISVACTNIHGTDTKSIAVQRGTVPTINLSTPADGLHTTENSVDLHFTVDGGGGPTCTVNGLPATSGLNFPLAFGANTITLRCQSLFGSSERVLTISRGEVPWVLINAAPSSVTPESRVNVTYWIADETSIPAGTTCSINGRESTSFEDNPLDLEVGENTVTVTCSNAFGDGAATVTVTFTPPPSEGVEEEPTPPTGQPPTPPATPAKLSVTLASRPALKPLRKGGMFTRRGGLPLKIKLDVAAKVKLRVERVGSGKRAKSAKLVGSGTLELAAGTSRTRLSGRAGNRALRPGRYRVSVTVPGTKLRATSKIFRIKR